MQSNSLQHVPNACDGVAAHNICNLMPAPATTLLEMSQQQSLSRFLSTGHVLELLRSTLKEPQSHRHIGPFLPDSLSLIISSIVSPPTAVLQERSLWQECCTDNYWAEQLH